MTSRVGTTSVWVAAVAVCVASDAAAQSRPSPDDAAHRAIYRELIEIDSSPAGGGEARAAATVGARLLRAGFAPETVDVNGPVPACQNVVATLAGRNRDAPPLLLLAHLDVVNARREDWTHDPFVLREEGGFFFGRGTLDNKAGASVLVANMVNWKRDGFVPARDLVMVLTCDEETTAEQGMQWVLAHHPRLRTAEYALNTDAGGVTRTDAGRYVVSTQAAEKVYATFTLTATNPGGHSSAPRPDNAIYALAGALQRLAAYRFPVGYNDVTRESFARRAPLESGALAADLAAAGRGETSGDALDRLARLPHENAQLRTTCVATMLAGGHAENALPQSATATVNCRILPGESIAAITAQITAVVDDSTIAVALTYEPVASPPSPLRADVMRAIERLSGEFWPGSAVVPGMSNGATDGLYLRNAGVPVYGVAALFLQDEDDFAHGLNERLPVASLYQAREFWDRLVRSLAAQ
ncbi:MAG: M20/M25/M40 family metallo-hydrolase [Vicinamibacterales bacterium]